jgi:hypothetical protein
MQRDIALCRSQGQDNDQIRRASVKEISRKDEGGSAAGLWPPACRMEISEPDFATAWFGHQVLETVTQRGIQLPQLGLPCLPCFFILAEFCVSEIGALEEETAPLVFDGLIEHLLQGRVGLFRHLREALVRCGADTDRCWHTNLYTSTCTRLSNDNVQ